MSENNVNNIELQKRVPVKNLCPWNIGIGKNGFDINIEADGVISLTGEQIETLLLNRNIFFMGTGNGDHAKLLILDDNLRKYFELDNQLILDEEKMKYIYELKTDSSFESNLQKYVVLNHEKDKFRDYVVKRGYGDWSAKRFKFTERHLDRKLD